MTTQRDRLAAVLLEVDGLDADDIASGKFGDLPWDWLDTSANDLADRLLARGVRIVDADTLATAINDGWRRGRPVNSDDRSDAARILAALDGEAAS